MDPVRSYDYLIRSREKVLHTVRTLAPEQYGREFAFGLKSIPATLTHMMVAEWYYLERIEGNAMPPYEQWPIKDEDRLEFGILDATWRRQAERARATIGSERAWNRRITYDGFPDEQGRRSRITATAGDFFTQLLLHEVHHRAQVMAMVRQIGEPAAPIQDIDFNALMFERVPIPAGGSP